MGQVCNHAHSYCVIAPLWSDNALQGAAGSHGRANTKHRSQPRRLELPNGWLHRQSVFALEMDRLIPRHAMDRYGGSSRFGGMVWLQLRPGASAHTEADLVEAKGLIPYQLKTENGVAQAGWHYPSDRVMVCHSRGAAQLGAGTQRSINKEPSVRDGAVIDNHLRALDHIAS